MNKTSLLQITGLVKAIMESDESWDTITGELSTEAQYKIRALMSAGKQQIRDVAPLYSEYVMSEQLNKELKMQYDSAQKIAARNKEFIKNLIAEFLPEDESLNTGTHSLYYAPHESIQEDPISFSIDEFEKQYPQFVKVEKKLMKDDIKAFIKSSGITPENVSLESKKTLTIRQLGNKSKKSE